MRIGVRLAIGPSLVLATFCLGACIGKVGLFEGAGSAQASTPNGGANSAMSTTQPNVGNVSATAAVSSGPALVDMLLGSNEVIGGVGAFVGILVIWAIRRFIVARMKK